MMPPWPPGMHVHTRMESSTGGLVKHHPGLPIALDHSLERVLQIRQGTECRGPMELRALKITCLNGSILHSYEGLDYLPGW